jgi:CrcB protein
MAGVCGGYTTFSSFSLQTLSLTMEGDWFRAAANVILSVVLCLGAVSAGHLCAASLSR